MAASDEIADTSINYTSAPGWTGAVTALGELEAADNLDTIFARYLADLMGSVPVVWGDYSACRSLKIAAIGTDGAYLTEPLIYEDPAPTSGPDGGVAPQLTIVLSLRSGFTIGGGNYGRMYLPHTTMPIAADTPQASTASALTLAGDAKTFVNHVTADLNADIGATVFPAIMSQGSGPGVTPSRSPSGKGVLEVGIGTVIDTQRRRRNRLSENTQIVTLA